MLMNYTWCQCNQEQYCPFVQLSVSHAVLCILICRASDWFLCRTNGGTCTEQLNPCLLDTLCGLTCWDHWHQYWKWAKMKSTGWPTPSKWHVITTRMAPPIINIHYRLMHLKMLCNSTWIRPAVHLLSVLQRNLRGTVPPSCHHVGGS